ncbi:MAG: hypothetical protein HC847_21830 [Hydrococcus sp. RU_2_2]|nr:hypothetical protein [Hydrococcus sp. RU_2_2]NJP18451.1 hypothetical protein [Hydrococcus sp. CRU_1_1]NJQ97626.1 hypothetical protein [Hydrococcus sp. CSU_1_8]
MFNLFRYFRKGLMKRSLLSFGWGLRSRLSHNREEHRTDVRSLNLQ